MLAKPELFARLAAGAAAQSTVVTPNRRLAQALAREFDAFQMQKGLKVWEAPDILPFSAFAARLYEEATLFAMPSRFEPFGIVFLEAMAYGLPCIAADTCAMPEIVEHGRTGLVVPPGDADALAEALIEATADPARLAGMSAAARQTFLERWTWDHVGRRVARLFVQRLGNA